jgi:hypothetical protein
MYITSIISHHLSLVKGCGKKSWNFFIALFGEEWTVCGGGVQGFE